MNNVQINPIPEIGKKYHFFDDGKVSNSRHYIAECLEIITFEDAKTRMIPMKEYADTKDPSGDWQLIREYDESLANLWKDEADECDWVYAKETDYLVRCRVPKYDENDLWFARTKDGGWFSFNIQSWWQSGRLDVESIIYNRMIEDQGPDFYTDKIEKT